MASTPLLSDRIGPLDSYLARACVVITTGETRDAAISLDEKVAAEILSQVR